LSPKEFAKRRRQLMRMMGKGGIVILPASPARMRNRDSEYFYRQDSDFHYLTGFDEPDAVAVLVPGRPSGEFVLFCRERDPARAIWDGERVGTEGAVANFGADDAFPISDIDEILPGIIERCDRVYYSIGAHSEEPTSPTRSVPRRPSLSNVIGTTWTPATSAICCAMRPRCPPA